MKARLLALFGLLALLAGAPQAQRGLLEPSTFEEALEQYERYIKMKPLDLHSLAWARLARSHDPRGLKILIDSYKKPQQFKQVSRYLLAQIATREFKKDEFVDQLVGWREKYDDDQDAWLWYRTLSIECTNRGPETALAIALNPKMSLPLRAAAIEAMGFGKDPSGLFKAIEHYTQAMPKKLPEKAMLVGAMGTALEKHKRLVTKREFKIACSYFISLLNDEFGLDDSTKLMVARSLARILDSEEIVINSAPWTALLGDKKKKIKRGKEEEEYVRPTFFGVEATGSRICYVIDMSDSMCKDVVIPEDAKGPISGGPDAKKPKNPIPWHLVKTRFDLAREQVKLSLRNLDPDAMFSVIYFGDQSDLLDSSKGMVKASKGNVKKIIKELDGIETLSSTPQRPDGRLRGFTNLHSGIRNAFRVKKKGLLDEDSYIDLKQFTEGADTIFLLSDGNPSTDDYRIGDVHVGERNVGDPETGAQGGEATNLMYEGPYRNQQILLEEIERLNLFREVEIHCVAVGKDVSVRFLEDIAKLGHGKMTRLGD